MLGRSQHRLHDNGVERAAGCSQAEGATLTCKNEDSPRGTSGAEGIIAFQLDTLESEGCGLEDCETVTISAEEAGLVAQELNYLDALNQ